MKGRRTTRRLHPEGLRYFLRVHGYSCPDGHDPTKCSGCMSVRRHLIEQEQAFHEAWRAYLSGHALGLIGVQHCTGDLDPKYKRRLLRIFRKVWKRAIRAVASCDELTYCATDPSCSVSIEDGHMKDAHGLCVQVCVKCTREAVLRSAPIVTSGDNMPTNGFPIAEALDPVEDA